jgi:hypothetical protein
MVRAIAHSAAQGTAGPGTSTIAKLGHHVDQAFRPIANPICVTVLLAGQQSDCLCERDRALPPCAAVRREMSKLAKIVRQNEIFLHTRRQLPEVFGVEQKRFQVRT